MKTKLFLALLSLFTAIPALASTPQEKKLLSEVTDLLKQERYFDGEIYSLMGELNAGDNLEVAADFSLLRAISLWKLGDSTRALEVIGGMNGELKQPSVIKNKLDFYSHWIKRSQGDEEEWNTWVGRQSADFNLRSKNFIETEKQIRNRPQKSALVSGLMSAVIPGLGHARLGLWQDAALTFALNALFIGATIDFARNNQNFAALAAGGVGSFFYVGGIVSAVKLTEDQNERETGRQVQDSAVKIFPELRLEF